MDFVSLLDDSDDDIPLISPTSAKGCSKIYSSTSLCQHKAHQPSNVVDLLSSDDDIPIVSTGKIKTSSNDSDKTEVYSTSDNELESYLNIAINSTVPPTGFDSDRTEVYSVSDCSSGRPDLDSDVLTETELPSSSQIPRTATSKPVVKHVDCMPYQKRGCPTKEADYTQIKVVIYVLRLTCIMFGLPTLLLSPTSIFPCCRNALLLVLEKVSNLRRESASV